MSDADSNATGHGLPNSDEGSNGGQRTTITFRTAAHSTACLLGRLLIIMTFLDDSWTIIHQWDAQLSFLSDFRGFSFALSYLFLVANVTVVLCCSSAIILGHHVKFSMSGLISIIIAQGLGYGLVLDINLFLRNSAVVVALLMIFTDQMLTKFASLHNSGRMHRNTRLAQRVLVMFLIFDGSMLGIKERQLTYGRLALNFNELLLRIYIVTGYNERWIVLLFAAAFSVVNPLVNNWWSLPSFNPQRLFMKHAFFNHLAIIGGLLLYLSNTTTEMVSCDEDEDELHVVERGDKEKSESAVNVSPSFNRPGTSEKQ